MKEAILKANSQDKKFFHVQTKIQDNQQRLIKGFASTRFPDRVNDVVSPKALGDSMDLFMKNPVLLLDHDRTKPIGRIQDYAVNSDGLFVTAKVLTGTPTADAAWQEMEFGARSAFSIGFIPRVIDFAQESPTITELELLEISVVTIPANRESLFSIAKGFELGTDLRDKDPKTTGWGATMAQFTSIKNLIGANFSNLSTKDKIAIEGIVKELQNITQAEALQTKLLETIEAYKLQLKIEEAKAELAAFV